MSWREISVERMLALRDLVLVDVRSPGEHSDENIPGARNVPLLSDAERKEVGTVFKNEGELVARRLALEIISPKIPQIVNQILQLGTPGNSLVIHCWRGGLRSEAVASFLSVIGVDCWRLTGGYKSWRQYVLSEFAADQYAFVPVTLHGRTGVGKTDILKQLHLIGQRVLDLEALANHRGSVFGALGMPEQPTQKNFEGMLWREVRKFNQGYVFLEAESRKLGRLSVPDFLLGRIANGRRILVEGTLSARIDRLSSQYGRDVNSQGLPQVLTQLTLLKERLGKTMVSHLCQLARERKIEELVEILLIEYYDPLYDRHIAGNQPFELFINGDNPSEAAWEIARHCQVPELQL
jgi:tRNA 2-selenouridine synthase